MCMPCHLYELLQDHRKRFYKYLGTARRLVLIKTRFCSCVLQQLPPNPGL